MASQRSCQTKSSLAANKNVSPTKGPSKRVRADATKVASPGVNASSTGQHLRPCNKSKGPLIQSEAFPRFEKNKSKGLGKHRKLEDKEGATELRRPPTPIYIFEDECVFCHSFRTSEFHGPMVQYRKGRIVSSDEVNPTNTKYVHQKCMDWAPKVYLDGDDIVNMEKEISQASGKKCNRCKHPGAALVCDHPPCTKTYHVTCASMIRECFWDLENHHFWCPEHPPDPLPCDEMSSAIMEIDITSPILHNLYLDKQGMSVIHRREDQQVDEPNSSALSSLPQGQCSDKEELSADYRRIEKQMNQSRTLVNQWVLLGSVLSTSEKDSLKEFASLTSSTLAEEWDKNVTHVIVGRSADVTRDRPYEVLMAILSGKWVVTAGWIGDCLLELIPCPKTCFTELIPVPEMSYEVTSIHGPKKGRAGAAKVAPKLFSGLHFCLSAYMNPEESRNIKNLIAAAEGQVVEGIHPRSLKENLEKDPAKVYFIYASTGLDLFKDAMEVFEYQASGAKPIDPCILYAAIAEYDARILHGSLLENCGFLL